MKYAISNTSRQAMGLGAVAGMRAIAAPALLSHFLAKSPVAGLADSRLRYLQNPKVATTLKVLSAAELVGDKLPQSPDRIAAPQLLARIVSGALVGATVYLANGERKATGAVLGGWAAIVSSFAFFYLRKELNRATHLPDIAVALLEDTVALTVGTVLLKDQPDSQLPLS